MKLKTLYKTLTCALILLSIAIFITPESEATEVKSDYQIDKESYDKLKKDADCFKDVASKYDVDLDALGLHAVDGADLKTKNTQLEQVIDKIRAELRTTRADPDLSKGRKQEFDRQMDKCLGNEPSKDQEQHDEKCDEAVKEITEKEEKMQEACNKANISGNCLEQIYSCKYAREEADELSEDLPENPTTEEDQDAYAYAQQEKYATYKENCKTLLGTNLEGAQKAYERIEKQINAIQKSLDSNQENLAKIEGKEQDRIAALEEQLTEAEDQLAQLDLGIETQFNDQKIAGAAEMNKATRDLKELEIKLKDIHNNQYEEKSVLEEQYRQINASCFEYASGEVTEDRNCLIEAKVGSTGGKAKGCRRKRLRISSRNYYNYTGSSLRNRNKDDINRYYNQCMATKGKDAKASLNSQLKALTKRSRQEYKRTEADIKAKQNEIALLQNKILSNEAGAGKVYLAQRSRLVNRITSLRRQIISAQSSQRTNAVRANANIMQAHARLSQKQQEANQVGMDVSVIEANAGGKNYTASDVMAALGAANTYVDTVTTAVGTCECRECESSSSATGVGSYCSTIILNLDSKKSMLDKLEEIYPADEETLTCDNENLKRLRGAQGGSR